MKLIEKYGLIGIDKQEIDALIAKKKFIGLNSSPRAEKVIVSLTSYKPRINDVKYTIYSLLNQSLPPDKLILWLDEDSFPQREENLPRDLLKLKNFGLTIDWCENLRSYKKLIPALEKYPDDIIVTADDDLFYQPDWLKILYEEHIKSPDSVIAHRVHRIRFDGQGNIFPYNDWQLVAKPKIFCHRNFFTSGAGVLFKKKFFCEDVLRKEIFTELSPFADDIWFWAMTVLNGTQVKIPADSMCGLIYVDIDAQLNGETLASKNTVKHGNDIQLRQIAEKYPELLKILIREDAAANPYLSVVLFLEDIGKFNECRKNILEQSFPDFELIVVNIGERIELPPLPTNFCVINYPDGSFVDALNLGLKRATGKYILFKDADSSLPRDGFEIIARTASDSAADVIHFACHARSDNGKFVLDDALEFGSDVPIFFNEPKQYLAALWLQDKLSGRLDTKIFRREFLIEHKINFDDDLADFMFRALIMAEKYLLVPRAFCFCKE